MIGNEAKHLSVISGASKKPRAIHGQDLRAGFLGKQLEKSGGGSVFNRAICFFDRFGRVMAAAMALVGSININRRSMEKDEEVAVAICDHELTSLLESHFHEDVARSIAAVPEVRNCPVLRRIAARLLRPIR